MSRAKCGYFFRWLTGVILCGGLPTFVYAEGIQVGPAQVSGIELYYFVDLTGSDFCMLVPRLEEETPSPSQAADLRYRFLNGPDDTSAPLPIVKVQPCEQACKIDPVAG